jgi:hypothetical protein
VALAQRIDTLLAELAPLVEQWSGLGLQLYGASVMILFYNSYTITLAP